ncbi:MAG: efflux RND transporter periplasmic adaptor subunit [Chloroflexi bacterium]|nr:efflux RND transporter periplasmic adaptor subunit [Chloroflexota bacterium]MBV9545064.1 efflux RND transporter periplasmic adaptor subunit [Chloroflexota bacterium]
MFSPGSVRFRGALAIAALTCILVASGACLPAITVPGTSVATDTQATPNASAGAIHIGKSVRGDLTGILTFTAEIQSKGEVAVMPKVTAPLNKLDVELGSHVRAGDNVAELDHSDLDQQVLAAQAAQASAEAKLADLKAGPKAEVLAQAEANQKAAQARVNALSSARSNADTSALDKRVQDAQAALDQAQTAMQPDKDKVAQADEAAQAAHTKLNQLQSDPSQANNKTALDQARSDAQKADAAAQAARQPTGTQAAVDQARRNLQDAQQAQLMARLSTTAFDLDEARALLDVANAQVDLANAPASPEEIKAAETASEQAFAQAELARARQADATIAAPITGIVTDIKAVVGSTVSPSAAILTLIPPDMQVIVQADTSQVNQLQAGQAANLSVEGYPNDAFTGTVKAIAPQLNPRTHTVAVKIEVPDPQGKLRPGMFSQLQIQTGQRSGALMVPKDAVLKLNSVDPTQAVQSVVFTVSDNRVHRQVVTVGASDGKNVEVLQGLAEGVDLVLNPRPDFLDGELLSAH